MTIAFRPATADELADLFADVAARNGKIELRGGGSKRAMGADRETPVLDLSAFAGIVDYDPPELVLTVRAATPLDEVERLVAAKDQMLAFEPYRHGAILGNQDRPTIGGVVAAVKRRANGTPYRR
jgi:glycolate oxidase FAD binding subunit